MVTVPLTPNSELAVMSLFSVGLFCWTIPKSPSDLMSTLPPLPVKALALIWLFSLGTATINLELILILPPLPLNLSVPASVEI